MKLLLLPYYILMTIIGLIAGVIGLVVKFTFIAGVLIIGAIPYLFNKIKPIKH